MKNTLLDIQNLNVHIEEQEIIKSLDLQINQGEIHVIMGPNGAGKSTLGYTIMGHPSYEVTRGSIFFEGEDITKEKPDVRAKKGIFLSFQNPEELSGVTLGNFLRASKTVINGNPLRIMAFKKELYKTMDSLGMDKNYAERYLNVGFSGGEKKKSEILQMLMLEPKLAILDETDSGLDIDAVKMVSQGVKSFKKKKNSLLIITHNTKILEYLTVDYVHIMLGGRLIKTGNASLIEQINKNGYQEYLKLV